MTQKTLIDELEFRVEESLKSSPENYSEQCYRRAVREAITVVHSNMVRIAQEKIIFPPGCEQTDLQKAYNGGIDKALEIMGSGSATIAPAPAETDRQATSAKTSLTCPDCCVNPCECKIGVDRELCSSDMEHYKINASLKNKVDAVNRTIDKLNPLIMAAQEALDVLDLLKLGRSMQGRVSKVASDLRQEMQAHLRQKSNPVSISAGVEALAKRMSKKSTGSEDSYKNWSESMGATFAAEARACAKAWGLEHVE